MALADDLKKSSTITASGCWEWNRTRNLKGYGSVRFGGRLEQAHRAAFMQANGKIPDGMLVLHSCDNPPCINPDHLFLGTNATNTADMMKKGRANVSGLELGRDWAKTPRTMPSGDDHPLRKDPSRAARGARVGGAKLTESKVRAIRARRAAGEGTQSLMRAFGVSRTNIKDIVARRTWAHVDTNA